MRNSHTLWLLIGGIIFLRHEKISFDWTHPFFFSRVKNIVRSSDWLERICVWKLTSGRRFSLRIYLSMYKRKEGTVSTPLRAFLARKRKKIEPVLRASRLVRPLYLAHMREDLKQTPSKWNPEKLPFVKMYFSLLVLFLKGNEYEKKEWGGSVQLWGDCQILWAATVSVKK